jgi:ATP-binding cassette subfamily C protein
MNDATVGSFLRFMMGGYLGRSFVVISLLAMAGVAEGFGVITLLPLLELVDSGGLGESSYGRALQRILGWIGLAPTFPTLLAIIFVAILGKAAFIWFAMRQVAFTASRVSMDLRLRYASALLKAQWNFFGDLKVGSLGPTLGNEAIQSGNVYQRIAELAASILMVIAYLVIALAVSWQISLLALVGGGVMWLLTRTFLARTKEASQKMVNLRRSLISRTVDLVRGLKPIKAMARERLFWPLMKAEIQGLKDAQVDRIKADQDLRFFHEPTLTLLLCGALFMAVEVSGEPLAGMIVIAFVFYRMLQQLNRLQTMYQSVLGGIPSFQALMNRITETELVEEKLRSGEEPPPGLAEGIRLRGLKFSYGSKEVLQGVDLDIGAGSVVAVLGESGVGKTTLADLIVGLFEPNGGEILVDGRSLQSFDLEKWRRMVGYVPQEMLLLHASVFDNVSLGDPEVSEDDVWLALEMAGAKTFVGALADGLHTQLGEGGTKISGGQRQRIALARALVGKPSLLILDEVTTALDPETEAEICETLGNLRGKVTILSISHQAAMREVADVVFRMEGGRLSPSRSSEETRVAEPRL